MDKEPKKRILNKIIDNAPKHLWIILAYICLIPIAFSLSLNMAHIRADDYVNGMIKIELLKAERSITVNQDLQAQIKELKDKQILLMDEINNLKRLSHEPGG